jgi:hypothetical protein
VDKSAEMAKREMTPTKARWLVLGGTVAVVAVAVDGFRSVHSSGARWFLGIAILVMVVWLMAWFLVQRRMRAKRDRA